MRKMGSLAGGLLCSDNINLFGQVQEIDAGCLVMQDSIA